jgi:hypothetical protein
LSATELGGLLLDIPEGGLTYFRDPNIQPPGSREFHDQSKNSAGEKKRFSVAKSRDSGYFFSIQEGDKEMISVHVTEAELAVIRCLIPTVIPIIVGWSSSTFGGKSK